MPDAEKITSLTLTLGSSSDLEEGFDRLASVRSFFESRIKNRTQAGFTSTEVNDKTGVSWHWHLNVGVFGKLSPTELKQAWVDSAHELGVDARLGSQRHTFKTPKEAVGYAVKARLGYGETSLWGLATRAAQGDATADERWEQVQRFYLDNRRRRWRSSWVTKAAPARITAPTFNYSDSADLRRLVLLEYLGGAEHSFSSRKVQAETMTALGYQMSTATVSRIRRHPLMSGRCAKSDL